MTKDNDLIKVVADIVSAYVSHNSVAQDELPSLIESVHRTLKSVESSEAADEAADTLVPAIPIEESVTDDYIVCLEDGERFKSLKRHLRTRYSMTPEEYRQRWGLPANYPMVAPNYAQTRSNLAKQMGLGQKRVLDG